MLKLPQTLVQRIDKLDAAAKESKVSHNRSYSSRRTCEFPPVLKYINQLLSCFRAIHGAVLLCEADWKENSEAKLRSAVNDAWLAERIFSLCEIETYKSMHPDPEEK